MRAHFPISHGLARLHPPGVGLDLFFDRHDSERAWFVGACRGKPSPRRPFFVLPRPNNARAAARNKEGGGVLFSCFQGRGYKRAGLPRRRGSGSANLRPQRQFSLQEFGPPQRIWWKRTATPGSCSSTSTSIRFAPRTSERQFPWSVERNWRPTGGAATQPMRQWRAWPPRPGCASTGSAISAARGVPPSRNTGGKSIRRLAT